MVRCTSSATAQASGWLTWVWPFCSTPEPAPSVAWISSDTSSAEIGR